MSFASIQLPPGHRLVRVSDEPDMWRPIDRMAGSVWPEFMLHDPVADRCWDRLRTDWPEFTLALIDDAGDVAAAAQAAPLRWNGTDEGLPHGWDDQFERSVADLVAGVAPNALGAIQICVLAGRQRQGLSDLMLRAMREAARDAGLTSVIACVRPTLKARYPLMPIDVYAAWRRADGLPFDPWLRVHERAGARLVRGVPRSMTIAATVAEWREWTGMEFPASGPYVIEGALNPVEFDLEADRAVYHDPNVWMVHGLAERDGPAE